MTTKTKKIEFDTDWAIDNSFDFFYNDYIYEGLTLREIAGLIQGRIKEEYDEKVGIQTILNHIADS